MYNSYKELIIKNLYYIVVPYLVITLVLGVMINGFLIAAYILLIPISMIGSLILNYNLTQKSQLKYKWLTIIGLAIVVGLVNYLLLWLLLEKVNYPFKFNP